ncbi:MAG: hypothetical protein ACI9FD_000365 [Gammaproteobacteria bacterium]|jgi:hypothetical protein
MNQILLAFLEICLLRRKPQDLPSSDSLLIVAGVLVVLSYTVTNATHDGLLVKLIVAVAQIATFSGVVWLVLKIRNFEQRWKQTTTALFGSAAIFQFATLPFMVLFDQGTPPSPVPQPILIHLFIGIWYLAVMAHILRHSLETSMARGVMSGLFCQLTTVFALLFVLQILGINTAD